MGKSVTAQLKYLRMGPRKVRLVADVVRGKKADKAVQTLSLMPKKAARPVRKLIESAMANAVNNFSLAKENLRVASIMVDGGPVLKRWMPKAHGRATPVRERTSHIKVVLEETKSVKEHGKKIRNSQHETRNNI